MAKCLLLNEESDTSMKVTRENAGKTHQYMNSMYQGSPTIGQFTGMIKILLARHFGTIHHHAYPHRFVTAPLPIYRRTKHDKLIPLTLKFYDFIKDIVYSLNLLFDTYGRTK
jgi:hypothetical protein